MPRDGIYQVPSDEPLVDVPIVPAEDAAHRVNWSALLHAIAENVSGAETPRRGNHVLIPIGPGATPACSRFATSHVIAATLHSSMEASR